MVSNPNRKSETKLSLWGWGIAIDYAELSTSAAKGFMTNGISANRLEELLEDADREMGPTDVSLSVNGETVASFHVNEHRSDGSEPFKIGNNKKFYVVNEDAAKGDWGSLSITEPFDASKLKVSVSSYDLNGYNFSYFGIAYDGQDLESDDTEPKGGRCFMLTPEGEEVGVDLTD